MYIFLSLCTFLEINMKRDLYQQLIAWKKGDRRKPLLLIGARQVGKTWLINKLGNEEYKEFVYRDLKEKSDFRLLLESAPTPEKIIEHIGFDLGYKLNPEETLICLDEIQAVPQALSSLELFYREAPQYHIVSAGSNISTQQVKSLELNKAVHLMTAHPLSFVEYLKATDNRLPSEHITNTPWEGEMSNQSHQNLLKDLCVFLFLGGMPAVVNEYLKKRNIATAREIQMDILDMLENGFAAVGNKAQRRNNRAVWNSIPDQLKAPNKKFKYRTVYAKARASTYSSNIESLRDAGLIQLAYQVTDPKLHLQDQADQKKFKIYHLDTGLLAAMYGIHSKMINKPDDFFSGHHNALIENFVANELTKIGMNHLSYWTSRSDAEVDFLLEGNRKIYPLEVSSRKKFNIRSLRAYEMQYTPPLICRISPQKFLQKDTFVNLPLYQVSAAPSILESLVRSAQ